MIFDFYRLVPRSLWAKLDSAAVVWLYSSAWVSDYDQSLVDYTKRRFQEDFNSTMLIVRERSWRLETYMEYGWGAALGPSLLDVTAIGPGFDNVGAVRCYGQQPLKRDRLDGYNYRDDWERALRSGSNVVVIETWNELHEGTEICETVEMGRAYIDLTRHYSSIFKEGSWDPDLKEIDSALSLIPSELKGAPGEEVHLNLSVKNTGWRSWPEYLDLSFFFLMMDGSERVNRALRVTFPHRLAAGDEFTDLIALRLPSGPGLYRVLVSTGQLGKRLELEAAVIELPWPMVLLVLPAVLTRRKT